MFSRLVIDGNAVYEIDEECMRKKDRRNQEKAEQGRKNQYQQDKKPYQR